MSGEGGKGRMFLYSSSDLRSFSLVGIAAEGDGSTGSMWECPSLFPLDGSWVLIYSVLATQFYEVGEFDGKVFTPRVKGRVDAGPDMYAAQAYKDAQGRHLIVGWMRNLNDKEPTRVNGWAGAQSVQRELFLRADGGLGSRPIAELEELEIGPVNSVTHAAVSDGGVLRLGDGDAARVRLELDVTGAGGSTASFVTVRVRACAAEWTEIRYQLDRQELSLDTSRSGYGKSTDADARGSAVVAPDEHGLLRLDVLVDRSSVEVFANDGTVLTGRMYPRYQESTAIEVRSEGGEAQIVTASVRAMGSCWN